MAVPISTPVFNAGAPRLLFEHRTLPDPKGFFPYDISLDGRRFLMVQPVEPEEAPSQINIVINWFEELKQRVPSK